MKTVIKQKGWLVALGLVSLLSACAPPEPTVANADKFANRIVNWVGKGYMLDDAQKAALYEMYEDFKENEALRLEYAGLADHWIAEIEKPRMDPEVLVGLMRRRHELDMKSEPEFALQMADLHSTLNEEQKNKLIAKLNRLKAWLELDVPERS